MAKGKLQLAEWFPINFSILRNIFETILFYDCTYSDSISATVHLYCAVEKRQMSANCRTETLIFLTVLLELLAMWTFTDIDSPW